MKEICTNSLILSQKEKRLVNLWVWAEAFLALLKFKDLKKKFYLYISRYGWNESNIAEFLIHRLIKFASSTIIIASNQMKSARP